MGDRAYVLPVRADDSSLIDLIAFRLETPHSFWPMSGAAAMLGQDQLERAHYYGRPLIVHETPLEWLRAKRVGVVILDWNRYWPAYVGGLPALRTFSERFGRTLEERLKRPLLVPDVQVAA
jgi:hypothetical protein